MRDLLYPTFLVAAAALGIGLGGINSVQGLLLFAAAGCVAGYAMRYLPVRFSSWTANLGIIIWLGVSVWTVVSGHSTDSMRDIEKGAILALAAGMIGSMKRERPPSSRMRFRLGLLLVSILVSFILVETLLRTSPLIALTGGFGPETDKWFWTHWDIERFARRYHEGDLPRGERTFRILHLGDSFGFGAGVDSLSDILARRLEGELESDLPGRDIEVVNATICGWSTRDEREYLEEMGDIIDPDLVLVGWVPNDATLKPEEGIPAAIYAANSWLDHAFATWGLLRTLKISLLGEDYATACAADLDGPAGEEMREEIARIAEWGEERNIPVVFALWPFFGNGDPMDRDDPLIGPERRVAEFIEGTGARAIVMRPAFAGRSGMEWRVSLSDAHPNAMAHANAARFIAAIIRHFQEIQRAKMAPCRPR